MAELALVTGASSGIGAEIARYHAEKGGDLILTARRADALQALKSELEAEHGITAHVMVADLAAAGGAEALCQRIADAGLTIEILVNNAGFGAIGKFIDHDLAKQQSMIDLNVKALVTLTHAFVAQMVARGRGRILNIGSVAGTTPGPNQLVYFATKAFVNSFSHALSHELRRTGVTCTVMTPGFVETEFAEIAGMDETPLAKSGGDTARHVAKTAYDAMMKGKYWVYNSWSMWFQSRWLVPNVPRRLAMAEVARRQQK